MSAGDTQPTLPLEWTTVEEPRRRRAWPWFVAFVVVVLLAVAAWFIGEAIARDLVVKTIRSQIATNLALPADQQIDVDVPGVIIAQLIGGSLHEVRVQSQDVALGPFEGDISVEAFDVPIRGDGDMRDATATVRVDEAQLRGLMASVDGFPADALGIEPPFVTASTEFEVFGAAIPVGVSLTPGAAEGSLVLTPASVQVAGAEVTADELRRQFGILSNAVLRDWPVCIAQYLPAGLVLSEIRVESDLLIAEFDIDDGIIDDPAMLENGTC